MYVYLCWFWFLLFIFWLELCAIILKTVNNIMYVSIYICMSMYVYIRRTNYDILCYLAKVEVEVQVWEQWDTRQEIPLLGNFWIIFLL